MAEHSNVVGGSTAARTLACPGWRKLAEKMPPDEGSAYAREGTLLHHAIEKVVLGEKTPHELLGLKYLDQELTEDLIEEKLIPAYDAYEEYFADPSRSDRIIETELHVEIPEIPGAFGSADVVATHLESADELMIMLVLDWKFGSGVSVPVKENQQLAFYAHGALRDTDFLADIMEIDLLDIDVVRLAVVQHGKLNYWDTTPEWITQQIANLAVAVEAGEDEHPHYAMGDHCRFCPAKTICPAHHQTARAALIEKVDSDNLAYWMDKVEQLEQFTAAVKKEAHAALEAGVAVTGWKLVAKRAQRKWADFTAIDGLLRRIAKRRSNELKLSDFQDHSLKTPAQVEKILQRGGVDKKELVEYISSKSSGTTLAPEDDARPGINVGLANLKLLEDL